MTGNSTASYFIQQPVPEPVLLQKNDVKIMISAFEDDLTANQSSSSIATHQLEPGVVRLSG